MPMVHSLFLHSKLCNPLIPLGMSFPYVYLLYIDHHSDTQNIWLVFICTAKLKSVFDSVEVVPGICTIPIYIIQHPGTSYNFHLY